MIPFVVDILVTELPKYLTLVLYITPATMEVGGWHGGMIMWNAHVLVYSPDGPAIFIWYELLVSSSVSFLGLLVSHLRLSQRVDDTVVG